MKRRWHGGEIDRSKKPTFVHVTLASAFTEAKRLSEIHPKQHFAVFECIGYVKGAPIKKLNRCESNGETAGKCEPVVEVR